MEKKLIKHWTEEEIQSLRNTVERELLHLTILDIRVCGSFCHGGSMKDLDLVVIVKEKLIKDADGYNQFRWINGKFENIPLDMWVYNKSNTRCKIFNINGFKYDLPWFSIMGGKHNEGKDLEKWRKAKKEGLTKLEMKGDRVINGSVIVGKHFKVIDVKGGKGCIRV